MAEVNQGFHRARADWGRHLVVMDRREGKEIEVGGHPVQSMRSSSCPSCHPAIDFSELSTITPAPSVHAHIG